MKRFITGRYLCALLFLFLMGMAVLFSGISFVKIPVKVVSLSMILDGQAAASYEKKFDTNLAHRDAGIAMWNTFGYAAFGEGAEGLLIGQDGWLFTNEEFIDPHQNRATNQAHVVSVATALQKNNIKLLVIPIPSKARIYQKKLGRYKFPEYWNGIYNNFLTFLAENGIVAINLQKEFEKQKETQLYFKTDTHWTPMGARVAAMVAAMAVEKNWPYVSWKTQDYISEKGDIIEHEGDLLRYTSLNAVTAAFGLKTDQFYRWNTVFQNNKAQDLFGDVDLPVVLVGTSYSANPLWNFAGFLKENFATDILNVSDDGIGPFAVMDNYLNSDAYKKNKPKLVIWEIPERYLASGEEGV